MRVVLLVAVAGCFSKPPRPELGDGSPGDDGADANGCTSSAYRDDFETANNNPCGTGFPGNTAGSCVYARTGGVLTMSPQLGAGNDCSCTTGDFLFAEGILVEVAQSLGPGGTFTILQLETPAVSISVNNDASAELHMDENGGQLVGVAYNPTTMRWWRLRPVGGQVRGEYSKDGASWVTLATTTSGAPAMASASINAGTYGTATPMSATFDNFGVCP